MYIPRHERRTGWIIRSASILFAAWTTHFGWEMGQADFYSSMQNLPVWRATAWCARAALSDVFISAIAYGAAAAVHSDIKWCQSLRISSFAIYIAVGLVITIAIERWAVESARWSYDATMPTVAGIGLSPLLQWIVVPVFLLVVARSATRRSKNEPVS